MHQDVHISTILSIHEFECATYTDGMCREHITPGAFKLVVDDDEVIRVYCVHDTLCFVEHDGDTYLFNSEQLAE